MRADANLPLAAAAARELWELYGISTPEALVLEDLAMALGVIVVEAEIDSADAWLLRDGSRGVLRVNAAIPQRGRRRFAIAHEIGHWRLHEAESQLRACTDRDMRAKYKGSRLEVEANAFAAELLMPDGLFRGGMRGSLFDVRTVERLAEEFDVSVTAAAVRYAALSTEEVAVVVAESGRIKWWRGSESFRERYWIEPNTALGRSTAAAMVLAGDARASVRYDIDIDEWVDEGAREFSGYFIEIVLHMPAYDTTLSLLSAP